MNLWNASLRQASEEGEFSYSRLNYISYPDNGHLLGAPCQVTTQMTASAGYSSQALAGSCGQPKLPKARCLGICSVYVKKKSVIPVNKDNN